MNGDVLSRGAKVVVLTSGGDAPGMNAALRAVGRVGHARGFTVLGVEEGYKGLIAGRMAPLDLHTLDDAARRGGTILGSARSKEFVTTDGQQRAHAHLVAQKVDAVIVIGGNGSLTGAATLGQMKSHTGANLRVAGIPASIDNDLACTSMSIGVDTAMNTIVEACDRI
jgi:6-phosphofructokinase 1